MKTSILCALSFLTLLSCNRSKNDISLPTEIDLVSPTILATEYSVPFKGGLQIYPCEPGSAIYAGNYSGKPPILRTEPAGYVIGSKGELASGPAMLVPIGNYTMVYWGVPYNADTVYNDPAIQNANVSIGGDLQRQQISLHKLLPLDTTYSPTFDYVFQVHDIQVGSQPLDVKLRRVVAGIVIAVLNENNKPLSTAIESITAQVGGVARSLNFFTAQTMGEASTVSFPLTFNNTRMMATNLTVMVFPSIAPVILTLIIKLQDGTQHILRTPLHNPLIANNRIRVVMNLNQINATPGVGSGFEISQWIEANETIDLP